MSPSCTFIKRGDVLEEKTKDLPPCPLLVCTTNDALESIIRQTPTPRLKDLVFLQNGMLLPLLTQYGLQSNTQALMYLSALEDGTFTDGKRTVVTGRWAAAVCGLFNQGALTCHEVSGQEYLPLMVEKLLWSSIFWLLSDGLGGKSVGDLATCHSENVKSLAEELCPVAQNYLLSLYTEDQQQLKKRIGQSKEADSPLLHMDVATVTQALLDYSLSIAAAVPSKHMAVAEFRWRNGWFLAQMKTPLHEQWLKEVELL